jgi:hypothetical protein
MERKLKQQCLTIPSISRKETSHLKEFNATNDIVEKSAHFGVKQQLSIHALTTYNILHFTIYQ